MKMTTTMMSIIMILMLLMLVTTKISKKVKFNREKNTPFECGFNNFSSARKPFSISFFLLGMMFLIFDMEISIILPMMITKMTIMKEWLMFSMLTMMILIIGLIHEWKNGMLEWKN